MRRLALLVPVLVALVGGMTACSDKTDGSAQPTGQTTTEPTGSTPTTRTTSSRPTPTNDLKSKNPCSLLPSAGQSQLGISNGQEDKIGSARRCRWQQRQTEATYLYSVLIYDNEGIKDLPSEREIKQLPDIGSHKAVERTESANPGICAVILGVTDSSRVTTQVTAGTDTQKGCDLVMKLAQLVEPELPRG